MSAGLHAAVRLNSLYMADLRLSPLACYSEILPMQCLGSLLALLGLGEMTDNQID